jgi:hypothetical protein
LLAQNGILSDQVFAAARDIRDSASGENGRFWFGEFLDGFFDTAEERFAGIYDSRQHDEVSILVS